MVKLFLFSYGVMPGKSSGGRYTAIPDQYSSASKKPAHPQSPRFQNIFPIPEIILIDKAVLKGSFTAGKAFLRFSRLESNHRTEESKSLCRFPFTHDPLSEVSLIRI